MSTFYVDRNEKTLLHYNGIDIIYANQQKKVHGCFKLKTLVLHGNEEKTFFVWKELVLK